MMSVNEARDFFHLKPSDIVVVSGLDKMVRAANAQISYGRGEMKARAWKTLEACKALYAVAEY